MAKLQKPSTDSCAVFSSYELVPVMLGLAECRARVNTSVRARKLNLPVLTNLCTSILVLDTVDS